MGISSQDKDAPITLRSACKSHVIAGRYDPPVAKEDILHAYAFGEDIGINANRHPPTYMKVGPNVESTHLYEIGYFEAPNGPHAGRNLICHAMTARPSYEERFWRIVQEWI